MSSFRRWFLIGLTCSGLVMVISCQPFHPRHLSEIQTPPLPDSRAAFSIADVDLYLKVQDNTQQSLATFDCDLLRAGVYPIWISWHNRSSSTLDFSNAEIRLEMPSGKKVKILNPSELVERLYRSYSIRLYSTHYRQELENHFSRMAIMRGRLQPGDLAQGYLFAYLKPPSPLGLQGAKLFWTRIHELGGSKLHVVHHVFSPD